MTYCDNPPSITHDALKVIECLRMIHEILMGIDRSDRLKFCKGDFEAATKVLRRQRSLWSNDLFREIMLITLGFFDQNSFQTLPIAVVQHIFLWLPVKTFAQITCVNHEWRIIAHSNEIWTILFVQKFLLNNPGEVPKLGLNQLQYENFRSRLLDPQVGDKVEVAWRGKFRLETQDVYQGLAWWLAEIVDKQSGQGRYKIRYPGWDSRWDEWVPRCRLRWTVQRNQIERIEAGDIVELWCCGANVPGAWLESKVKKVRHGNKYCLGRVLSTGFLWVERDRLRLVRKGGDNKDGSFDSRQLILRGRSSSFHAISLSFRQAISQTSASCSVM